MIGRSKIEWLVGCKPVKPISNINMDMASRKELKNRSHMDHLRVVYRMQMVVLLACYWDRFWFISFKFISRLLYGFCTSCLHESFHRPYTPPLGLEDKHALHGNCNIGSAGTFFNSQHACTMIHPCSPYALVPHQVLQMFATITRM